MNNRFIARAIFALLLVQLLASPFAKAAQETRPAPPQQSTQQQPIQQPVARPPETIDSLKARLLAHVNQPRFAPAAWGIKIVSLDTGKIIFEQNAQKYFSPASNAKLFTAALALARLGPDYRIKTSVYAAARPTSSGTIKGGLIIYGRGDPMMAARLNNGDYYKGLEPLVNQIVNAGVKRIEGDLIADDSYFTGPRLGTGWEWDDLQEYYGAEVSALTVNDNSIDLFVKPAARVGLPCVITTGPPTSHVTIVNRTQTVPKGAESRVVVHRPIGENIIYVTGRLAIDNRDFYTSVSVHNPALMFAGLVKQMLAERGVTVTGSTRVFDWRYREGVPIDFSKLVEIAAIESPPIREIVRETLKPSQNLFAQLLLLQVGVAQAAEEKLKEKSESEIARPVTTSSQALNSTQMKEQKTDKSRSADSYFIPHPSSLARRTTERLGLDAMSNFLSQAGIKKDDVLLEEGSGLSRKDMITPEATVALLRFMSRHAAAEVFRIALPIAGFDGTLRTRMRETAAAGNVRAKTGSLRYVSALSGYVTTSTGERLAFSIMLNNYYNSDRSISSRDDIDAIPIMLAEFTGKSQ